MIETLKFVRIACANTALRVASPRENVLPIIEAAHQLAKQNVDIVLFPELCLTGCTCGELFHQSSLLHASEQALEDFLEATVGLDTTFILGIAVQFNHCLFNAAAVIQHGSILGIVPKTYLPNYMEFYENRWFSCAKDANFSQIEILGQNVPFGVDLLFFSPEHKDVCIALEICEDLWVPLPPSTRLAMAGASIIFNPSASNELVGKSNYRHSLISQQSARCVAAYAYCSSGFGESSTDLVYGGHAMIYENGVLLTENQRFCHSSEFVIADIDVEYLRNQRLHNRSFADCATNELRNVTFRRIPITIRSQKSDNTALIHREINRSPFIPSNPNTLEERCREIIAIQSNGLATRLRGTGINKVVIGLSGGLDSTLALLVCVQAFESLLLPRENIYCVTMPGFGTSQRTLGNVLKLCELLNLPLKTINIGEFSSEQLKVIEHDGITHDTTYENVQARQRTLILMNLANRIGGIVIGTGDLSELALGWCTYNGDHMSMYAVNTGVPKTLVKFLINFVAENWHNESIAEVLKDILDTPISPELLPAGENDQIAQLTEKIIGPYEIHDFFLYQIIRNGFGPKKIATLAKIAFADSYSQKEILNWLEIFIKRFFNQQFKRSCIPDGPKVGTVNLSPRGDWRMPSDADAKTWLAEIESLQTQTST